LCKWCLVLQAGMMAPTELVQAESWQHATPSISCCRHSPATACHCHFTNPTAAPLRRHSTYGTADASDHITLLSGWVAVVGNGAVVLRTDKACTSHTRTTAPAVAAAAAACWQFV
jgi:hypothetical protein